MLNVGVAAVAVVLVALVNLVVPDQVWAGPAPGTDAGPFAWATDVRSAGESSFSKVPTRPAKAGDGSEPPLDGVAPATASRAVSASIIGDEQAATFVLTLSHGVPAEVYSLANPYRVVIDLPDVDFALPESAGRTGQGLVAAYRFGQFAEGKARIVIDTAGPVMIAEASMAHAEDAVGVVLRVALKRSDAASFGAGTGAARAPPSASQPETPQYEIPARPARRAKPVIVIDPGHGGIDPGAVGPDNMLEKNVVLAVAHRIRSKLGAGGRYQIVLTRDKDIFISLDKRIEVSRRHAADLFVSLHADSIDQPDFAQAVKGATVYTLSERASDAEARAMAEKENASDLLAGLDVASGEESNEVKSILIDLMKRETANFSNEFSRALVNALRSKVSLARDPRRSAAFKVLKQTHAPSVLIELGYISHHEEARQMKSSAWQDKVATAIVSAVDAYFSKRAQMD